MFTGCGTALVTPFRKDLSLDEEAVRRLARRQVEAGIDFLVPCGTTGESPTLTHAEQRRVVEITIEEGRRGKVPVVAGAGGNNTARLIQPLLGHVCARLNINDPLTRPLEPGPNLRHIGRGGRRARHDIHRPGGHR